MLWADADDPGRWCPVPAAGPMSGPIEEAALARLSVMVSYATQKSLSEWSEGDFSCFISQIISHFRLKTSSKSYGQLCIGTVCPFSADSPAHVSNLGSLVVGFDTLVVGFHIGVKE